MSDFFKKFPYTTYSINGSNQIIKDFFRYVDINDINLDLIIDHNYYIIQNGDRPDNVSQYLYGTPFYDWTFFIINDHLKEGYNYWPKSYNQLQEWLEKEYSKFCIFENIPIYNETASAVIGSSTYFNLQDIDNYYGGIDLTDENLKFVGQTNFKKATAVGFDANKCQLWLKDFDSLFEGNSSFKLTYEGNGIDKTTWLLTMIEYFKNAKQTLYYSFVEELSTSDIKIYSQEYFDLFEGTYLDQLVFTPTNIYYPAYNAPYQYVDLDSSETRTAYDVISGNVGLVIPKTYREWEEDTNFENSKIKIIQPRYIKKFSEIFKDSLNDR
jgi:hypothetical protein